MRRFGWTAYVLKRRGQRKYFETKANRGIFVGYNENSTYKIYIPETNRIVCDSDVKFIERENGSEWFREREDIRKEKRNEIMVDLSNEANEENDDDDIDENREEQESIETCDERRLEKVDEECSGNENTRIKILDAGNNEEEEGNEQEINPEPDGIQIIARRGRPKNSTKEW